MSSCSDHHRARWSSSNFSNGHPRIAGRLSPISADVGRRHDRRPDSLASASVSPMTSTPWPIGQNRLTSRERQQT